MEKRILTRINPYVSARCDVHCSSCGTAVKPAMSIERGYAVEARSLVEPLNNPKGTKPVFTWTNNRTADKAVNGETEPKSILPVDNVEIVCRFCLQKTNCPTLKRDQERAARVEAIKKLVEENNRRQGSTLNDDLIEVDDKVEAIPKVNDGIENKLPDTFEDESDTESDETLVQKNSSESETVVQKSGSDGESEHLNEDLEESDDGENWKDADKVKEIFVVSPSKYKDIELALDKVRFCLQKTNGTTLKRSRELSQEGVAHVEAIKKLVEENIPRQGSTLIDDLSFISIELFKTLEALKYHMLDCQLDSLLDTVLTLEKDLKTEMATLDENEQSGKELPSDLELATPDTDPLMNFLKDAPWTFFGFISLVAANLGYFSQPWLFHSFHSSFMKFSSYLKNDTFG